MEGKLDATFAVPGSILYYALIAVITSPGFIALDKHREIDGLQYGVSAKTWGSSHNLE